MNPAEQTRGRDPGLLHSPTWCQEVATRPNLPSVTRLSLSLQIRSFRLLLPAPYSSLLSPSRQLCSLLPLTKLTHPVTRALLSVHQHRLWASLLYLLVWALVYSIPSLALHLRYVYCVLCASVIEHCCIKLLDEVSCIIAVFIFCHVYA